MDFLHFEKWITEKNSFFNNEFFKRRHPTLRGFTEVMLYLTLSMFGLLVILYISGLIVPIFINYNLPTSPIFVGVLIIFIFYSMYINALTRNLTQSKLKYNEYIAYLLIQISKEIEKFGREKNILIEYLKELHSQEQLNKREIDLDNDFESLFVNDYNNLENFKCELRNLPLHLYNDLWIGTEKLNEWTQEISNLRDLASLIYDKNPHMVEKVREINSRHPNTRNFETFSYFFKNRLSFIQYIFKRKFSRFIVTELFIIAILLMIRTYHLLNVDDNYILGTWGTLTAAIIFWTR